MMAEGKVQTPNDSYRATAATSRLFAKHSVADDVRRSPRPNSKSPRIPGNREYSEPRQKSYPVSSPEWDTWKTEPVKLVAFSQAGFSSTDFGSPNTSSVGLSDTPVINPSTVSYPQDEEMTTSTFTGAFLRNDDVRIDMDLRSAPSLILTATIEPGPTVRAITPNHPPASNGHSTSALHPCNTDEPEEPSSRCRPEENGDESQCSKTRKPSQSDDTSCVEINEPVERVGLERPVVADVRVSMARYDTFKKREAQPTNLSRKDSWSTTDIDKLDVLSRLADRDLTFRFKNRQSSFATGKKSSGTKSVYLDLGLYRTLLRPGTEEEDADPAGTDAVPSPPLSPACPQSRHQDPDTYSEDTLKAVKLISEKFDSFRRGQMRAVSFRYNADSVSTCADERQDSSESRQTNDKNTWMGVTTPSHDRTTLTSHDVARIELFFNSQDARVYACRCLADLYVGTSTSGHANDSSLYLNTGVPVLLFNTGVRGMRRRELFVLLAQRDTGMPLWQDKICYMSGYQELSPLVHTMRVSGSVSKSIRFNMFDATSAAMFLVAFQEMTSDPRDELWTLSGGGAEIGAAHRGRQRGKHRGAKQDQREQTGQQSSQKSRTKALTKRDISVPCHFQLVTRVNPSDEHFLFAFGDLLPTALRGTPRRTELGGEEELEGEFRPRLPTN